MNTLWSIFLLLIHISAIKIFTSGFLKKRQPFLDISEGVNAARTSLATHQRAIILVVDALRFDFLAPNPPHPQSPFQHNVLTLPRYLSAKYPHQSFLFDAFADPPTTTLQRIKAIATGSLPTFVDAGNNLGASSIPDDSLLNQAKLAGKKIAFLGDNTWMSVFPDEFAGNMTFAYHGLNVEDLHTVDDGIAEHLFPLLEDKSKPFDILIAHFLGVDHVGHRVGGDHPRMRAKLGQMQTVLERVVELLDEETLLVVLGDHGMDHLGSHCGDSTLETSSAMWIYSKGLSRMNPASSLPPSLFTNTTFPGASSPHRSIQQIDLLPTLSLRLGLPIPFNNLGTVIPELFSGEHQLHAALKINAQQIDRFLDTYHQGPQGGDLDPVWDALQRSRASIQAHTERISDHARHDGQADSDLTEALAAHTRVALAACRQIWARFDFLKMATGLALMGLGMAVSFYLLQRTGGKETKLTWQSSSLVNIFILATHACTLAIPALTVWEDRIVALLLHACILPHILTALNNPHPHPKSPSQQPPESSITSTQIQTSTATQRRNLLRLCLAFLACIHLAALSTICREEQRLYCRVTFYSTSPGSGTAVPLFALALSIPASFALPSFIGTLLKRRVRAASMAGDEPVSARVPGAAVWFLPYIFRPALVGGNVYWVLEWADSGSVFGEAWCPTLRLARTWVARFAFGTILVGAAGVLCASWIQRASTARQHPQPESASMTIMSNYLCIVLATFTLAYIPSQLTGQLVLCLCLIALLLYLEILRRSKSAESGKERHGPTSSDIIVLPLLAILAFYGTGHQATITSLQLKSAFLVHHTVVYPYSRVTLVLNSLGPFIFMGFAAPLLAIWTCAKVSECRVQSLRAAILLIHYCSIILCACMVGATLFASHHLIWRVAAPRYLLCVMTLGTIEVTAGAGLGLLKWFI